MRRYPTIHVCTDPAHLKENVPGLPPDSGLHTAAVFGQHLFRVLDKVSAIMSVFETKDAARFLRAREGLKASYNVREAVNVYGDPGRVYQMFYLACTNVAMEMTILEVYPQLRYECDAEELIQ